MLVIIAAVLPLRPSVESPCSVSNGSTPITARARPKIHPPEMLHPNKVLSLSRGINQNTAYTQFRLGLPGFRVLGFGFLSLSFEKNAGLTKGFEHVKGYAGSIASKRLVFSETVKHERGVKHQQLNRIFMSHVMSYLDQMHSLWKLRPGSGIVSEPKASIHR